MSALAAIHAEKKRAGLGDAEYRDLLWGVAGKRSSKDLTPREAGDVLDRLRQLAGPRAKDPAQPSSRRASGPYAPKLQALWMALSDLGIVRERSDKAMLAFVTRQTRLDHTRFLTHPADAAKAIEALKAMAAKAGVDWPRAAEAEKKGAPKLIGDRLEVIAAQGRILQERTYVLASADRQEAAERLSEAADRAMRDLKAPIVAFELLAIQTALGAIVRKTVNGGPAK